MQRIWDLYGLKPRLAGRLQGVQGADREVVGLYLNPPDKMLVLAWDSVPHRLTRQQSQDWGFTAEGKPTGLAGWWRALQEVERTVVGDSRKRAREQPLNLSLLSFDVVSTPSTPEVSVGVSENGVTFSRPPASP